MPLSPSDRQAGRGFESAWLFLLEAIADQPLGDRRRGSFSNLGILGQNIFGPTLYTQRYWDRDLCVVFLLDVGLEAQKSRRHLKRTPQRGQTLANHSFDMRSGSQLLRALQSVKDLGGRKSYVV